MLFNPHPRNGCWLRYLLIGFALILAYYLVPRTGSALVLRIVIYCSISGSAAVTVLTVFTRRRRDAAPGQYRPWLLLALAQTVYACADATFYVLHYLVNDLAYPGPADLLYLSHYPLVVFGLALLIRRRSPGRDLPSLLDAAVLAVVAAMLSWLFVIEPQARLDAPLLVKAASLGYPVADLALLAVSLRLVLGTGRRSQSFWLLSGNLFAIFAADTIYTVQQLHSTYQAGNFLDAIWLAGNLALGAAALHPTSGAMAEPANPREHSLGPARILSLCGAALIAPATLLLLNARRDLAGVPVVAVACAVLFALTIARLAGVVAVQRRLAITDPLTGLHTRRFLEANLPLELARARRSGGSPAVLIVDVDHFKAINDRYGHPAGDRALVEIARRLRSVSRAADILARHGGEEFAVLVPDALPGELARIGDRLRQRVAAGPVLLDHDRWVPVTVSVGVASFPTHGGTPGELVSAADQALYLAKAHGRDRVMVAGASAAAGALPLSRSMDRTAMVDYLRYAADQVDVLLSRYDHSQAISRWAVLLAAEFGLDESTRRCVELAGRLHDVGKLLVPEWVLQKPGPLTEDERAAVRRHPEYGSRLVRTVPGLDAVATVIRQHHERYDGLGYPDRLAGPAIRMGARILAVCDSWAAMRCDRPHQRVYAEERARLELEHGRGTQFDPEVVEVFLDLHGRGQIELPAPPSGVPAGPAPPPQVDWAPDPGYPWFGPDGEPTEPAPPVLLPRQRST